MFVYLICTQFCILIIHRSSFPRDNRPTSTIFFDDNCSYNNNNDNNNVNEIERAKFLCNDNNQDHNQNNAFSNNYDNNKDNDHEDNRYINGDNNDDNSKNDYFNNDKNDVNEDDNDVDYDDDERVPLYDNDVDYDDDERVPLYRAVSSLLFCLFYIGLLATFTVHICEGTSCICVFNYTYITIHVSL
jgi:hypothetical protein